MLILKWRVRILFKSGYYMENIFFPSFLRVLIESTVTFKGLHSLNFSESQTLLEVGPYVLFIKHTMCILVDLITCEQNVTYKSLVSKRTAYQISLTYITFSLFLCSELRSRLQMEKRVFTFLIQSSSQ